MNGSGVRFAGVENEMEKRNYLFFNKKIVGTFIIVFALFVLGLTLLFQQKLIQLISFSPRSYEQILLEESPREALQKLQEDINSKVEIANNCHPIAHKLGQLAFEKYQSFSEVIVFQNSLCNSGFIHGVIEGRLKGSRDITTDISGLCNQKFRNHFEEWQCFHGIGHGVMYFTNNNLPISLQYCSTLDTSSQQQNCANGVYMENFNTNLALHSSEYLKADNSFYPCNDPDFPYKNVCYYSAPIRALDLNQDNYLKTYNDCLEIDSQYINPCIAGIAGNAVKKNFNDVWKVEDICNSFNENYHETCIRSMISMYINMKGSMEDINRQKCELFDGLNKNYCLKEIESKQKEFQS
jgi:hypothetical protein